jgi:predicted nucleotidyltransferase
MEKMINKNIESNLSRRAGYLNYLTDNEIVALTELKEKIAEKYPGAEIILYGSKARGDYDENSDIDILIVINDNYNIDKDISFKELEERYFLPVDKKISDDISNILVHIQVKYCISIDYQIKNKSYINTNLAGIVPLYQNIKKEGIKL